MKHILFIAIVTGLLGCGYSDKPISKTPTAAVQQPIETPKEPDTVRIGYKVLGHDPSCVDCVCLDVLLSSTASAPNIRWVLQELVRGKKMNIVDVHFWKNERAFKDYRVINAADDEEYENFFRNTRQAEYQDRFNRVLKAHKANVRTLKELRKFAEELRQANTVANCSFMEGAYYVTYNATDETEKIYW